MSLFDAATVPLQGLNLIEASAGTGKTFTLAELYCRLITEKNLEVSQILVVTYTRAATEELRGRLRKRLVTERQQLLNAGAASATVLKRLQLAIQSFDEAAIYTIHGFCQRALQDFAFESGHAFDMEMVTDEQEIKQAVADDFWRRHISTTDADFARYLLSQKQTPETLLSEVASLPGKPYLTYLPLPEFDAELVKQQAEAAFAALKSCWHEYNSEVIDIVSDTTLLNGNMYRKNSVLKWLVYLEQMLNQAGLPEQVFADFNRFTRAKLGEAVKSGQTLPAHPFWAHAEEFLLAFQQLQSCRERQLQQLRMQLATYLSDELPKRKQQLKLQAFDDLLLNLQQALHGEQGRLLSQRIRQQFHAALIDEFQDTDPIQYDCFNSLFSGSGHPVFFVGDPKQAIYSFRGADIFTYLTAKSASEQEFNLDTNWRSHPLLVEAVNTVFHRDGIENPFVYREIPFHPVKAAREDKPTLVMDGQASAPFEFVWLEGDKGVLTKGEMEKCSANITAGQIAQLLQQSTRGKVLLTDKDDKTRALNGGDIAVLVRSHSQATSIQQALRQRGINSVMQSRENVFQSEQAIMLERVLLAIANPSNDNLIATALATPIFAKTASEIFALQQDDNQWLAQTDLFITLHEHWRTAGFIVMLRSLLVELDVQRRLLQQPDGERQLTNLMHLAELIQAYASRRNSTIEAIMFWFAAQRQSSAAALDAAQIRLESDEQLVKVITIHTSKGLEYPVVFCPFLWHQGKPRQKPAVRVFHRGDQNEACAVFGEPGFSEAEPIVAEEEKAEDLRLLYVALTRARERCVILWGAVKEVEQTALFSLLHARTGKLDAGQMYTELATLVADYPANFVLNKCEESPVDVARMTETSQLALQPRQFRGIIARPWQIGSFSSLSRGHTLEQPDYDAETVVTDWPQLNQSRQDRFGFPRGANAGTCLHSLFEHWNFQDTGADWQHLVSKTLNQFGIDSSWTPVVSQWLNAVVSTPLDSTNRLTLKGLSRQHRLDEMAFYFPISELTVTRLKQALTPFTDAMPILDNVLPQLNFSALTGFMKGFIDLVFEYQGQFYVADYKSNWLGDSAQDYQKAALNDEMVQHGYPLQYLIYSLALHRYLLTRLPDYDPAVHFGGVYYLFIRGMQAEWGQAGVYFDRPSAELLDALDRCMQEAGHD